MNVEEFASICESHFRAGYFSERSLIVSYIRKLASEGTAWEEHKLCALARSIDLGEHDARD